MIGNGVCKAWDRLPYVTRDIYKVQKALLQDARFKDAAIEKNLGKNDMKRQFSIFCSRIERGDDVMFFFAGHGITCGLTTYLIPTDAIRSQDLTRYNIEADTSNCISLDYFTIRLALTRARLKIIIVDACASRLDQIKHRGIERCLPQSPKVHRSLSQPTSVSNQTSNGLSRSMMPMNMQRALSRFSTIEELYTDPLGTNILILQSAARGCTAIESTAIDGGWYTDSFLRCMKQEDTTVGNLHATVNHDMTTDPRKRRQKGKIQIAQEIQNTISDPKLLSLKFFQA